MKKFFFGVLACLIVIGLAAGWLLATAVDYYTSSGPLAKPATLVFQHGEKFEAIVGDLAAQGVIARPLLFKAIAAALGQARHFKAGEYAFAAAASPASIMETIASGHVVVHKLTVAEGLTVREVVQLLKNETALAGDVPPNIPEGSLLPETYHFTYGETRQDMIARMQAGMTQLLNMLWAQRKPGLPFTTPQQALTLASIVEKETGIDSERGRVAAVFLNRLKKGMKLQSDPTVAYGLEQQANEPLGRLLTLDDLKSNTPYNTYVIAGLPPGPIANPGRAALVAALNPPDTNDLYFVATGSGGHNFAATLAQHDKNVAEYRRKIHIRQ